MKDKTINQYIKFTLGLAGIILVFMIMSAISKMFNDTEFIVIMLILAFIGILNADLSIDKASNNDFLYATIVNTFELGILMLVTRIFSFIAIGYTEYVNPLNILISFMFYFIFVELVSFIFLYAKGEIELRK